MRLLNRSVVTALAAFVLAPAVAHAETITVTTNADAGAGSLRAAIDAANLNVTHSDIRFAADIGVIATQTTLPIITTPMTIESLDTARQIIQPNVAGTHRPFHISAAEGAGEEVTLRNLHVRNGGLSVSTPSIVAGGNILVSSGWVVIDECRIEDGDVYSSQTDGNTDHTISGTIAYGGAIAALAASSKLTVTDSELHSNSVDTLSWRRATSAGGAIYSAGTLIVERSTFTENSARAQTIGQGADESTGTQRERSLVQGGSIATGTIARTTLIDVVAHDSAARALNIDADTAVMGGAVYVGNTQPGRSTIDGLDIDDTVAISTNADYRLRGDHNATSSNAFLSGAGAQLSASDSLRDVTVTDTDAAVNARTLDDASAAHVFSQPRVFGYGSIYLGTNGDESINTTAANVTAVSNTLTASTTSALSEVVGRREASVGVHIVGSGAVTLEHATIDSSDSDATQVGTEFAPSLQVDRTPDQVDPELATLDFTLRNSIVTRGMRNGAAVADVGRSVIGGEEATLVSGGGNLIGTLSPLLTTTPTDVVGVINPLLGALETAGSGGLRAATPTIASVAHQAASGSTVSTDAAGTPRPAAKATSGAMQRTARGAVASHASSEATADPAMTITFTSPLPADATFTVSATGGTATSGSDYTLTSPLVVAAGATSALVPISVINDTVDELDETVELTLIATSGWTSLSAGSATLTITDDDAAVTTLTVTPKALNKLARNAVSFTTTVSATATQCSVNGAPFAACTSPFTVTTTSSRLYAVDVRAVDASGTAGAAQRATWRTDRLAPTITSMKPRPNAVIRGRRAIAISALVRDRGGATARVTRVTCHFNGKLVPARLVRVNARGVLTCRPPKSTTRRRHIIRITAYDAAGNVAARAWRVTRRA